MAHARDPIVPPSEVRADVPGDLDQVVLKCLSKRREARYPAVNDLGKALASCASASEWDGEKALEWWAEFAPSLRAAVSA